MSRELGNELPAALLSLLDGHDLPARMGKAILITTVDTQGWAHPALLSYGEVVAIDASPSTPAGCDWRPTLAARPRATCAARAASLCA